MWGTGYPRPAPPDAERSHSGISDQLRKHDSWRARRVARGGVIAGKRLVSIYAEYRDEPQFKAGARVVDLDSRLFGEYIESRSWTARGTWAGRPLHLDWDTIRL